jgi:hypothetical protein
MDIHIPKAMDRMAVTGSLVETAPYHNAETRG